MYLVVIPQLWLHALVTAALAGAIAHILYPHHRPRRRVRRATSQISKAAFERARASFVRVTYLRRSRPRPAAQSQEAP